MISVDYKKYNIKIIDVIDGHDVIITDMIYMDEYEGYLENTNHSRMFIKNVSKKNFTIKQDGHEHLIYITFFEYNIFKYTFQKRMYNTEQTSSMTYVFEDIIVIYDNNEKKIILKYKNNNYIITHDNKPSEKQSLFATYNCIINAIELKYGRSIIIVNGNIRFTSFYDGRQFCLNKYLIKDDEKENYVSSFYNIISTYFKITH